MKKKHILLGLTLTFSSLVLFGQNTTHEVTETEGIVILGPYDPSDPAFVTDFSGKFVFSSGVTGSSQSSLYTYNGIHNRWERIDNTENELQQATGATNTSVVNLGSKVEAIYWKDASGSLWCLSYPDVNLSNPSTLEELWEIKNNEVIQTTDMGGNIVWKNKLSIDLHYKNSH